MNIRTRLMLDELQRHRTQFEHLCRSLTEDELARYIPGSHWTVKDYLVHLCTIDGLIASGMGGRLGLDIPAPSIPAQSPFDIDDWNESVIVANRNRSMEDLLAEAKIHRQHLVSCMSALTDELLDKEVTIGGDRKAINLPKRRGQYSGTLWAIAIHDPTHTADIVRALPHLASQNWVQEWLGSVNDSRIPEGVREWRA